MEQIIFKNICKEIMRECKNRSIKVSERFIAYYVKLLLLNPAWNISLTEEGLNRIDLQNFVKYIYTTLENEDSPNVIALKMQLYFQCNFDTNVNVISVYRNKLNTQLHPLQLEILNFKSTEDIDLKKLLKLIVNYLTLMHGLGNPTSEQVYKEAEAALKSVFYNYELIDFVHEENHEKKIEQLEMLSKLVAGIRVFNGRAMKSGEGIEDLPSLLLQANEQTHSDLHYILHDIMNFINALTTAIDVSFIIMPADEDYNASSMKLVLQDETKYGTYIDYLMDLLLLYRQFEVFVRQLIDEVQLSKGKLDALVEQLEDSLKETYSIVYHKTMVQASIIYPQFVRLADIWHAMQNVVIHLSNIHDTLENLKIYSEQANRYEDIVYQMIGKRRILTDQDRMENTGMYRLAALGCKETKILNPSKIPNFEQQPLELLGFCPWKFVESGGALIPGNPGNGVVQIKKKFYVFSCLEAVQEFINAPDRTVNRVLELARLKPEVIDFLRLNEQLYNVRTIYELVKPIEKIIATNDENIQTEDHPIKSYIDPEYMWNVWDWKRKALKMADIAKRVTKSTQTTSSSARSSIKVQTHFLKDHNYQTKKDAGTNVPTPSTFIFGLRGRTDDKQFIITLTRPIEERTCADLTENCRK